jgi:hypothetical protein
VYTRFWDEERVMAPWGLYRARCSTVTSWCPPHTEQQPLLTAKDIAVEWRWSSREDNFISRTANGASRTLTTHYHHSVSPSNGTNLQMWMRTVPLHHAHSQILSHLQELRATKLHPPSIFTVNKNLESTTYNYNLIIHT